MDAKKFITEYVRMCKSFGEEGYDSCGDPCDGCPINEVLNRNDCSMLALAENPELAVELVNDWSVAHPLVTNRDKIREVFGEAEMLKLTAPVGWWDLEYNAGGCDE